MFGPPGASDRHRDAVGTQMAYGKPTSNMGAGVSAPSSVTKNVAPEAAASDSSAARPQLTLRTKGILALSAMVVYVAAFALYVAHDREVLLYIVQQREQIYGQQQAVIKVNAAVAHSIVELQYLLNTGVAIQTYGNVSLDLAAIKTGLPELKERYPGLVASVIRFEGHGAELQAGWSADRVEALRDSAQVLGAQLEALEAELGARHRLLTKRYGEVDEAIFVVWLVSSVVGVVFFGTLVTVFFTRLAADIKKLETRAVAIVNGYRGAPLEVKRRDEVGGLIEAVNRMQCELRRWEQRQEVSRQQRFHQEKMAAVGSLAAAVAHEVNNPIAAISGIAQSMTESRRSSDDPDHKAARVTAQLILQHAERIGSIMRQVANLTTPRSPHPELLDLNMLVQATTRLISYDKRFHGIDLVLDLQHGLPAINAIADHLTQVLMNLLINSADAMEGVEGRKPTISVSTRATDDEILLSVMDNGHGMDCAVLSQAFEESFTTKPAGKGRGIGLFLCRTLVEEGGGRVVLESTRGTGTTVQVRFPSRHSQAAAH
jgi:two-component system, NtrC family, sensor kinase